MSHLSSSLARSHGVLLSRLLWPTGLLFAVTLSMVLATFLWTSHNANLVAAERQKERLAAGLDQRLEALRDEFARYLARLPLSPPPGEDSSMGAELETVLSRGFDGTAILTPSGARDAMTTDAATANRLQALLGDLTPLRGSEQESSGSQLLMPDLDRIRRGVETRLLSDGEGLFAVLTARPGQIGASFAVSPNPTDQILAWKRIDGPILTRLGTIHDLPKLRVAANLPATGIGLPLTDARGQATAYVTWDSERPGDLMLQRLMPMVVVGLALAGLLFIGVAFHFHATTKNLAATDAISKELLGRDPLSGLANRMLFNEKLDKELARVATGGKGLAVMFIDLDRFKDVNDAYGHQAGDDLIQLVAHRLLQLLPAKDTLARLGGDEFAIIQTEITAASEPELLSRQILDALSIPCSIAHTQVMIGTSVGVALAPEHARDRESLMKLADTALYQAKSEGRNRACFFQTRMDETVRMRKVVEDDLRRAIENDELLLHYQPLFSADGEKIVALEALVRWPHPERGMISPAEFVPIAEERGLVIPLGEWVLRRACRDGARWPHLRIAVNVSPIQFRHRGFVESVVRVLESTGFDSTRLELELTEGVVVGDADAAEAAMIDLRALGVHLALDDFGTGYSSLIYLRRFAFDKIKIDRSFLESMEATGESAILVHSIVHLGRALGLIVTAEGVETREQQRFLQALGCHQLQGYLFSRPVPAEQIDLLLAAEREKFQTAA